MNTRVKKTVMQVISTTTIAVRSSPYGRYIFPAGSIADDQIGGEIREPSTEARLSPTGYAGIPNHFLHFPSPHTASRR